MPIYEYLCPQHGKFEKKQVRRETDPFAQNTTYYAQCPKCGHLVEAVMSVFSHYWFNPLTVDGEAFTSKFVRHEEVAEMNQECRER